MKVLLREELSNFLSQNQIQALKESEPENISIAEFARQTGRTIGNVYTLKWKGVIPFQKVNGRLEISRKEVKKWRLASKFENA
jgi:hypothetical protein